MFDGRIVVTYRISTVFGWNKDKGNEGLYDKEFPTWKSALEFAHELLDQEMGKIQLLSIIDEGE